MKQGDGTYKASIENLPVGKYTVSENANAVANYTRVVTYEVNGKKTTAESATVTISNGATTTAAITNTYTYVDHEVEISKTDINGAELAGAKLQVTVADTGEVVDAWTSGTETHKVTVKPGTYVLHESGAPENYVVASDIRFTVDENGKVTVAGEDAAKVTMVDDYTEHSVTISKRNIGGTEIAGAKLRVTDESGAAVQEWTSAAAEHSFTVKPGTYVLHEDAAPNGYKVANDITFTVSVDGTVTVDGKTVDKVIMIDYRTGGNGGGGGGGGNHPGVPVETTTAAETTPAETTTEAAETTTAQDTPETDEYGNVIGANRNKKKPDDGDDGTTKGAGRNRAKTGDDSMMPFFGLGFFGSLMALLGWVGIRFTKREH